MTAVVIVLPDSFDDVMTTSGSFMTPAGESFPLGPITDTLRQVFLTGVLFAFCEHFGRSDVAAEILSVNNPKES